MKENTTAQRVCTKHKAYMHPKVKVFKEGIVDVIRTSSLPTVPSVGCLEDFDQNKALG